MVKLVDAGDSKSPDPRGHVGSIPTSGTKKKQVNKGLKTINGFRSFLFLSGSLNSLPILSPLFEPETKRPVSSLTSPLKHYPASCAAAGSTFGPVALVLIGVPKTSSATRPSSLRMERQSEQ